MTRDELRKAMIERFRQLVRVNSNATEDIEAAACELVDNALAMMPDRAGEFPVGGLDESGRLVTYERRFTVRVAVPHGADVGTFQRARVDVDLDGYPLNSIKVDSNAQAIGQAISEILQRLIVDSSQLGIDRPASEV